MQMTWKQHKTAIEIMSKCDPLSITEDDMKLIIATFGTIIKALKENGANTDIISAQYAILKVATWSEGYFCQVTKQMCNDVYRKIEFYAKYFDDLVMEV